MNEAPERPTGPADPGTAGLVPLEPRVLRLWRIRAALVLTPVVLAAATLVGVAASWPAGLVVALVAGAIVATGAAWWTSLVWRSWQFRVGDDALHLRRGVLTRHESTIPYHRVQHIDLEAGPLERQLGLTSLVLRTASASTDSTVPGIDVSDADELRHRILGLVGTGDAV